MLIAIVRKINNNQFEFIGSGFLINKNGLFISCGHNFRNYRNNKESYLCAVPSDENVADLFPIRKLNFEYNIVTEPGEVLPENAPKPQKAPVFRDVSVGNIEGEFNSCFILNRKRPKATETIRPFGYRNPTKRNCNIIESNKLDISHLTKINCEFGIKNRGFAIFSKLNYIFKLPFEEVPNIYKYNNAMMLNMPSSEPTIDIGSGMSGCPIIDQNDLVVGIFLGNKERFKLHYMLCSKYITKYLRYFTLNDYEFYQDIPLRQRK